MKTILIVDDSAFTRNIHKQILGSAEYRLVEAASGTEAIEMYQHEKPDLVLIDLLMPDMDGMDVVKELLTIDAEAKVVVCSTDKQKYRKQQAQEVGAVDFLTKPVNAERMREVVLNIFKD